MVSGPLNVRPMQRGEEATVCGLAVQAFDEFVAPHYGREGINEFHRYAAPAAVLRRSQANHFVLVAAERDAIIGLIEVRDNRHIALLFVDGRYQRRGIGRALLAGALAVGRDHDSAVREVTVHATPNSLGPYERLGFRATGPEEAVRGIRFTPMVLARRGEWAKVASIITL